MTPEIHIPNGKAGNNKGKKLVFSGSGKKLLRGLEILQ